MQGLLLVWRYARIFAIGIRRGPNLVCSDEDSQKLITEVSPSAGECQVSIGLRSSWRDAGRTPSSLRAWLATDGRRRLFLVGCAPEVQAATRSPPRPAHWDVSSALPSPGLRNRTTISPIVGSIVLVFAGIFFYVGRGGRAHCDAASVVVLGPNHSSFARVLLSSF